MESVAETHNHSLLCLDELAQIDNRYAAEVAYLIANGEGKTRQNKNIIGRRSLTWQLFFLSTGEISLADKMSEAGITIKGGQEVRVLDIPADICKFGVFDTLHDFPSGQKFADHLRSASRKFYGVAIREFLRGIIGVGPENEKKVPGRNSRTNSKPRFSPKKLIRWRLTAPRKNSRFVRLPVS